MDYDLGELGSIKTVRALNDPVITHEYGEEAAHGLDGSVFQDIDLARMKQNMETPLGERIEYATWPETVVYFSTLTMDARFATEQVSELYQHSFRRYLDDWRDDSLEGYPEPLNEKPDLSEPQINRLDDLRFGIKKDRDRHFVDEMYDELGVENVPKSFWLTEYELDYTGESDDDFAQSALEDYTD